MKDQACIFLWRVNRGEQPWVLTVAELCNVLTWLTSRKMNESGESIGMEDEGGKEASDEVNCEQKASAAYRG